jgi:hypothetical protein
MCGVNQKASRQAWTQTSSILAGDTPGADALDAEPSYGPLQEFRAVACFLILHRLDIGQPRRGLETVWAFS